MEKWSMTRSDEPFNNYLGGGKNCVPAMKALSGVGYIEGSSNVVARLPVAAAVVAAAAVAPGAAVIRLRGC